MFHFQLAAEEQELKELMAIQELLADEDEDEFNVSFKVYEYTSMVFFHFYEGNQLL